MGSKLWASDMLLNDLIRPMTNAYQFKDYPTACNMLYQLQGFLRGYGEDVDNFPAPPKPSGNVGDAVKLRLASGNKYMQECKQYYEKHSHAIMILIGKHIGDVLEALDAQTNSYG